MRFIDIKSLHVMYYLPFDRLMGLWIINEFLKGRYKSTRVIIDCTEVICQMPSSLQLNWELFSAYKNHTTLKGLVDISPGGITPLVDLYLPLKDSGIVSITFLLGQMFICPNLKNIKLTHVINILLTVDADTLNNWARWSSENPCLSLHMTIKNSSRALKI